MALVGRFALSMALASTHLARALDNQVGDDRPLVEKSGGGDNPTRPATYLAGTLLSQIGDADERSFK